MNGNLIYEFSFFIVILFCCNQEFKPNSYFANRFRAVKDSNFSFFSFQFKIYNYFIMNICMLVRVKVCSGRSF